MANEIHVAFCVDRVMLKPAFAAMASLARAATRPLHIHACIGPDDAAAAALHAALEGLGVPFDVNTAAPEAAHDLPFISPYGGKSTAAYRRVFLDALYPELDRILYLDADVMACRDLAPLWEGDLEGLPLGAVRDPWWMVKPERAALFAGGYFNSGVLLIDLRAWREQKLAQRVADYVRAWKSGGRAGLDGDPEALTGIWGFQTEMNAALAGRWKALPAEWNASLFHFSKRLAPSDALMRARDDPGVVHFMGHEKPWDDTFSELTDAHAAYQNWRDVADRALPDFAWPGAYAAADEKHRRHALVAMKLAAQARAAGVRHAALTGGVQEMKDALPILQKAGIAIDALAVAEPGPMRRIAGIDVMGWDDALARGNHAFLSMGAGDLEDGLRPLRALAVRHGVLPTIVSPLGIHRAPPARLRLEATTHCQLACPSCPTAGGAIDAALGRGLLDPAAFEKLLAENPWLKTIELSNYGEALLHPKLVALLEIAAAKTVAVTFENGVNLNHVREDVLEAMVRTGVASVRLSIDGASQETYAQYRRGGDFRQVMRNVLKLVALKRRAGSDLPRLTWQFVIFEHNTHEVEQAARLAASLGMRFVTKLSWDDANSPQGRSRAAYQEETGEHYLQGICGQLWDSPQVNWNGAVLGCCRNFWGDFGGRAFADGLADALNGDVLSQSRRALMGREDARADSPCASCEIYAWRKKTGRWLVPAQE
jgi:lipopolysaccharide biosynthesis glycosyltransferase